MGIEKCAPLSRQLEITSRGVGETIRLGFRVGQLLGAGHVVCLAGELGAGKTTLVSGIGQGWNTSDRVTSPTFKLLNVYRRETDQQALYHLDAYRLDSPEAARSVGLDDILDAGGAVVIEWPAYIAGYLPEDRLWVDIFHDEQAPDHRQIVVTAQGARHVALLSCLRQ